MADGSEGAQFSELTIGIRELFRIIVPGAYALILFEWLTAGQITQSTGEGQTLSRIVFSVLAGLLAYGLQVHEKWLPYSDVFEQSRQSLNEAIISAANADRSKDYVNEYKYFLETRAQSIKERVHYFSSFYYMLDEMSLISVIAALALAVDFFRTLNPDRPVSTFFVLAALALQLISLYLSRSDAKSQVHSILRYLMSWIGIVAVWFLWNCAVVVYTHRMWPMGPLFAIEWRFWALVSAAVVFERLGAKQWKSVINEQVVLVKDRKEALREVMSTGARH